MELEDNGVPITVNDEEVGKLSLALLISDAVFEDHCDHEKDIDTCEDSSSNNTIPLLLLAHPQYYDIIIIMYPRASKALYKLFIPLKLVLEFCYLKLRYSKEY